MSTVQHNKQKSLMFLFLCRANSCMFEHLMFKHWRGGFILLANTKSGPERILGKAGIIQKYGRHAFHERKNTKNHHFQGAGHQTRLFIISKQFISLDQVQFRDKDNPELLVKGSSSQETKLVGTPVDAVHRLVGDL